MNQQNPQQQHLVQVDSDPVHKRRVLSASLHSPARLVRVLSQRRRLPHSIKQHRCPKRLLGNRPLAQARRRWRLGRQVPLESQCSDRQPLQHLGSPLCQLPLRLVVVVTLGAANSAHSLRMPCEVRYGGSTSSFVKPATGFGAFTNPTTPSPFAAAAANANKPACSSGHSLA